MKLNAINFSSPLQVLHKLHMTEPQCHLYLTVSLTHILFCCFTSFLTLSCYIRFRHMCCGLCNYATRWNTASTNDTRCRSTIAPSNCWCCNEVCTDLVVRQLMAIMMTEKSVQMPLTSPSLHLLQTDIAVMAIHTACCISTFIWIWSKKAKDELHITKKNKMTWSYKS